MASVDEGAIRQAVAMACRSTQMKDALQQVADEVAKEASALADREAHRSGDYMRGIRGATVGTTAGGLIGQVQATDYKSNWIEFGTANQPPKAIVRRAAEAVLGQVDTSKAGKQEG